MVMPTQVWIPMAWIRKWYEEKPWTHANLVLLQALQFFHLWLGAPGTYLYSWSQNRITEQKRGWAQSRLSIVKARLYITGMVEGSVGKLYKGTGVSGPALEGILTSQGKQLVEFCWVSDGQLNKNSRIGSRSKF